MVLEMEICAMNVSFRKIYVRSLVFRGKRPNSLLEYMAYGIEPWTSSALIPLQY